jgi:hypothetical protein
MERKGKRTVGGTSQFFAWYFEGLGGIGGWALFLAFYIAAAVWHMYDSQRRDIRVTGWRFGITLPGLLLLPTILYRFSAAETQTSLMQYEELFFYMGLLGGIAPVLAAVGYWITYRGLTGAQLNPPPAPPPLEVPTPPRPTPVLAPEPAAPSRPTVNAWLVDKHTNQSHQLFKNDTRIGRSKANNDIAIADRTISREHILIREEDGHFVLYDRGATAGTLLNGQRVRRPEMLAHGDIIVIGDTELEFTKPG